ncbi:hypothetical protein LCGC14_0424460 [marine sediment metagenome]|uniref:Uncharacterized protein n=1 Tax=marine sediment metagenome TaxID=412755 RepID=A0A0F9SVV4_9ZZZZ
MKWPKLPKIRPVDVASLFVMVGLGSQGYGLHEWLGLWSACLIVGTEVALMGLFGVMRHVG